MRIGIISKKEHAGAHKIELEKAGHKVVLLDSTHIVPTGPSWDLVFCRTCSVSHAATDAARSAARRLAAAGRTRPVISFDESVTAMLETARIVSARLAEEASQRAAAEVSKKPVRSTTGLVRAYADSRRGPNYWDLRRVDPRTKQMSYIQRFSGDVAAVQAHVNKLEEQEREADVRVAAAVAAAVAPAVAQQEEPKLKLKLKAPKQEEAKPESKPTDSEPKTDDVLPAELLVHLLDLERAMVERGLDVLHYERLTIRVTALHLRAPTGVACNNAAVEHTTTRVGEVTCKLCQRSKFYAMAKWVAENLKE